MGRQRKSNFHLPRGMLLKHGAYYAKRLNKWIPLGRDYAQALIKFGTLLGTASTLTRYADIALAMIEDRKDTLSNETVKNYRANYKNTIKVFGDMDINDITAPMIYQYVRRSDSVMGNRDKSFMSVVYTWARNNGYLTVPDPSKGLQTRKKEAPRQRYITDDEWSKILSVASPKASAVVRVVFFLGCRISDVLSIKVENITDDSLTYWNSKSKRMLEIALKSDDEQLNELGQVVTESMRLWRRFGRVWLFEARATKGKKKQKPVGKYTYHGFRSIWLRAVKKSGVENVTMHDIRRKAGSDSDSDERAAELLSHTSTTITKRVYRAKPKRINPLR